MTTMHASNLDRTVYGALPRLASWLSSPQRSGEETLRDVRQMFPVMVLMSDSRKTHAQDIRLPE